ncbi:MARVEL domain-containing protein [Nephila pilipes]|uniref:MARVEL domain-containing protein n=1 Tax=Nephila pilipes TaxID=299642 RepID=A0A8X6U748_NEPPI|nr:MARVEL domain-containing protein [Nephila pilipes]
MSKIKEMLPGKAKDLESGLESIVPEGLSERGAAVAGRAREFLEWTFRDVFDWNPQYLKGVRGILDVCEVAFGLLILCLVGSNCQNLASEANSEIGGFYCRNSDTFLFVVAASGFFASTLHLLCCLLSKKTDERLWATTYEMVFYIFYAAFFFFGGIAMTSSVSSRNSGQFKVEDGYNNAIGGGVLGIMNFIAYTGSAAWFFVQHKNKNGN